MQKIPSYINFWKKLTETQRQEILTRRQARWEMLEPEERLKIQFERICHFTTYIEAQKIIKNGLGLSDGKPLEEDLVCEEIEPFDKDMLPLPLPERFAKYPNTKAVYDYLSAHKRVSLSQIVKAINLDTKTVGSALGRLRGAGIVRVSGTVIHEGNHREGFTYEVVCVDPDTLAVE